MSTETQLDMALRLITKHGQTVTLVRVTDAAPPDPDKPWRVPPAPSSPQTRIPIKACTFDFEFDRIERNQVLKNDRRMLIPAIDINALPFVPIASDHVEFANGEKWTIENVTTVSPAGTPIIYDMQIRLWPSRIVKPPT